MKRYENVKMVLFDSTNAYFKLAVEAQFTRKNPDGSSRDLVYTTDRGTAILNPNIYLTLAYKDDNANAVYTSYPQLYRIRTALERVKGMLISDDAFITDPNDQTLVVKQTYAEPVVIDNIGKGNNWIQLQLVAIKTDENGISHYEPGVSLQLSTSNGYVSQLSKEEFLTVYTIIKDLNLSNIQCMLSLGFLNGERSQQNYGYTQPQQPQYYPQQPQYQQQTWGQPPTANWVGNQQAAPAPQSQQPSYMKPRYSAAPRTPSYRQQPQQVPVAPQAPVQQPQPQQMQPRQNAPIMSMKAVEETPVSNYDVDDTAAIDSIFND